MVTQLLARAELSLSKHLRSFQHQHHTLPFDIYDRIQLILKVFLMALPDADDGYVGS